MKNPYYRRAVTSVRRRGSCVAGARKNFGPSPSCVEVDIKSEMESVDIKVQCTHNHKQSL